MFSQKTKLQLCARNLTGVEYDLTAIDFTGIDLVGAVDHAANYAIGDYAIDLDGFSTMDIPVGCIIGFAGDNTSYYVTLADQRGAPGSGLMNIEISPPLTAALLDNTVATIYPHFDITQYLTNDVFIEQQAEFQQAELILDRPLRIELFNKNSVFYDRDTHSTGWGLTTAYFSTYNAQASTDNQYIRISVSRNGGAWQQKYNGKIIQHTLELDEINHLVSFECESVFYSLKDTLVSQVDELYYLHKYTSSTRKTKTPSGGYVDVIRALFKKAGVMPKSYTVTYEEKSLSNSTCTITTSATHSVVPGELISVSIGDINFDGTHLVFSVTSNTITYLNAKNPYDYKKDDVAAAVLAGNTSFDVQVGFTPTAQYTYGGKCKFAGHNTIYTFWNDDGNTVTVYPALTNNIALNEDVFFSYPTYVSSTAASGTVTAHRIYFDTSTDYFSVTHQGHGYDLLDLFWITEKWMVQDVESETAFNLFQELCLQLGACCNIDYIAGIAYGFFRSKVNASTSKVTLTSSKIIGQPKLNGNWPFVSSDGIIVRSDVKYWFEQNLASEFCYTEDLSDSTNNFRFLSETPTPTVLAYERYSSTINADTFNNLAVGDRILIRDDDTIYTITAVSGELITIKPPLKKSVHLGDKFFKLTKKTISIGYSNCFNIKLKYPNIFLTDTTNKTIRKYWNNGTATLGIHPMSYYTSEVLYTSSNDVLGVAFIKNIPTGDGYLQIPNGDGLCYVETPAGANYYVYTLKSKSALPSNGRYQINSSSYLDILGKLSSGYIASRNTDDNSIKVYNTLIIGLNNLIDVSDTIVRRLNFEMSNAGDTAAVLLKNNKINIRTVSDTGVRSGSISGASNVNVNGQVIGFASITANANEFELYRFQEGTTNAVFSISSGVIGSGIVAKSLFLNHDVLNPDYDDLVYADAGHAQCIRKGAVFNPTYNSASNVFTGTPPTAGTVYNFIVNHGESTAQEYYYCSSTNGYILKNAGTDWSNSTTLLGGTLGGVSNNSLWGGTYPIRAHTSNVKIVRKAYDNFLVIADPTDLRLLVVDVDADLMIYIEDTTVLDAIGDNIDIQCFTNWYDNQGAASPTIFENDVCANASKLAYKFYSKNRRPYVVDTTDAFLGYIDYTLFDRMTIDSGVLSAAGGASPKFYVYGSRFNLRTHDHKLTLLESVE